MGFGAELKDFAAAFQTTYSAVSDRRDKKFERERNARNDPIDNEYKQSVTEGNKLKNKWYDEITANALESSNVDMDTKRQALKYADQNDESLIRNRDSVTDQNRVNTLDKLRGEDRGVGGPTDYQGTPRDPLLENSSYDTSDASNDTQASAIPVAYTGRGVESNSTDWLQYANQGATRNKPLNPKLVKALDFLPDMGITMKVFSGGQDATGPRRTGSHRHDHGNAGDAFFFKNGRKLDWANANDRPIFQQIVREGRKRGISGIGAGDGYMQRGSMHIGFGSPSVWGRGGKGANAPGWLRSAYNNEQSIATGGLVQHAASGGVIDEPTINPVNNRPNLPNDDGSYSTELSVTVTNPRLNGGKPTNIPSIWNGTRFDPQDEEVIVDQALKSGQQFQAFDSIPAAVEAAKARSNDLGRGVPGGDEAEAVHNPAEEGQEQALPIEGPIPAERPAYSAVPVDGDPKAKKDTSGSNFDPKDASDPRKVGFDKAHEAVMEGVNFALQEAGLAKGAAVQDPDRAAKMSAYLRGAGAAPQSLINQAYDAVDPDHKLPEGERTMAALASVYDYYLNKNEPEKAKAAASSIIQYQRRLAGTYASIAQAAAEGGDIDKALEASVRAYAAVPDGKGLNAKKLENGSYALEFTDEATGKVTSKTVATPQQIGAWAMNVTPSTYDNLIMEAAGMRAEKSDKPSDEFQTLAAGLDTGKMPTNKEMAGLTLEEQKELRIRMDSAKSDKAAAAKEASGGDVKPLTYEQKDKKRAELTNDTWQQMQDAPESEGSDTPYYMGMKEVTPQDKSRMIDAATDAIGSPRNQADGVTISDQDALEAAFFVATGDGNVQTHAVAGGVEVFLNDYRPPVFFPMARFKQLENIDRVKKRNTSNLEQRKIKDAKTENAVGRAAAGAPAENLRRRTEDSRVGDRKAFVDPDIKALSPGGVPTTGAPVDIIEGSRGLKVDPSTQSAVDRLQQLLGL